MPKQPSTPNTGRSSERSGRGGRRPRPTNAVQITVWDATGANMSEDTVRSLEEAIEQVTLGLFNRGQRLLTQTVRG